MSAAPHQSKHNNSAIAAAAATAAHDIRNEMYANLPLLNASGNNAAATAAPEAGLQTNGIGLPPTGVSHRKPPAATTSTATAAGPMSSKEMLYATPLRKSDRFRGGGRSTASSTEKATSRSAANHSNGSNADVDKLLGNHHNAATGSGGSIGPTSHNGVANNNGNNGPGNGNNNHDLLVLGERRILSFLKDTSQQHKKMEQQRGAFPNSNFSCLAREEHFANLVQQNVHAGDSASSSSGHNHSAETAIAFDLDAAAEQFEEMANLDAEVTRKMSPEKAGIVGDLICLDGEDQQLQLQQPTHASNHHSHRHNHGPGQSHHHHHHHHHHSAHGSGSGSNHHAERRQRAPASSGGGCDAGGLIQREWVLKKVALCLEQRSAKANRSGFHSAAPIATEAHPAAAAAASAGVSGGAAGAGGMLALQQSHMGCIIMGSNGSGKTTICESILEGNIGTRGLLNRRLLTCYFVDSQHADCHNLSVFLRSLVLQILSHSSHLAPREAEAAAAAAAATTATTADVHATATTVEVDEAPKNGAETEMTNDAEEDELIAQLATATAPQNQQRSVQGAQMKLVRQQSEPLCGTSGSKNGATPKHSRSVGGAGSADDVGEESLCDLGADADGKKPSQTATASAAKPAKISKIPVKIGMKSPRRGDSSTLSGSPSHGAEQMPTKQPDDDTVAKALSEAVEKLGILSDSQGSKEAAAASAAATDQPTDTASALTVDAVAEKSPTAKQSPVFAFPAAPLPPKSKSCRTGIADEYYDQLLTNPDILDSLSAENIESNPDDCFKKALLYPLLELTPPKQALLLLIDSIDENYINEGNLMSTLKGRSGGSQHPNRSRNIAELLANHVHLFPKWLFFVCTAKKQNKHITRIFSGFKRITLDDLRKSHVVKDVQEYIIQRLNSDFKGTVNLSKEIIESLNQLYIKSNGCILYLQKVLNGIQEGFFSFREIKLIPCTLNGLYLYICQKSFNKKQYGRIRPILNVLLACSGFVERLFVLNCLRAHNYGIEADEFERRVECMRAVLVQRGDRMRIFHGSFADWLVDVKFATKKFLCDVNEGHGMIAMYYTLVADTLCGNAVRTFVYHLVKAAEWLRNGAAGNAAGSGRGAAAATTAATAPLDLVLVLLESRANLRDGLYANRLACCAKCETECKAERNVVGRAKEVIERFLSNELPDDLAVFLAEFFRPALPTDAKMLKLLLETASMARGRGNGALKRAGEGGRVLTGSGVDGEVVLWPDVSTLSSEQSSPMGGAAMGEQLDSELAELLLASERNCQQETLRGPQATAAAAAVGEQMAGSPRESVDLEEVLSAAAVAADGAVGEEDDDNDEGNVDGAVERSARRQATEAGAKESSSNAYARLLLNQLSEAHAVELHKGKALIHILANEGNRPLLERALRACKDPIDLEIEDNSGQTALNIAARNGHIDIVALLLNIRPLLGAAVAARDVDVNHADRDGWTPLRSASWGGHTDVVRLLIERTECSIDLADKEERTALRAAAWSGHEDILKLLIGAGANVNSVDRQGRTSLIAASYMGHYEIVELLLESGADCNHLDVDGRSALCVAALCGTSGYSRVISCLLEHGANTDQLDNDGMSPLLVSSFEGNSDVCELLLENGADPDLADFMGRTPLWAACTAGHAAVVRLLLFWGCGIDCMDSEGRTVLSIAAAQGSIETVRQLLDRGLDETHRDNAGWTPLHYAAFEGYADICAQLVESGAKIDECDNEGKTPLHLAAQEGRAEAVEALLRIHGACVDVRAHDGKTSFRLACIEGHLDCVHVLLKYGCDVNLKDADARTTLYILALENKIKTVRWLLEHSAAAVNANIPDAEGRTALHVAAWQGHVDMVRVLITHGQADVNAMDLDCRSPLHSCAWQGNHEVMEILLFCGALADHACKQGATALGISAQEGHEHCVRHLLQYGANPYKSDHCGRTPIKLAAKSNRNNVLRVLEEFSAGGAAAVDINFDQSAGRPAALAHIQKSPDKPIVAVSQHNPNLLAVNGAGGAGGNLLNATNSTQSSNNFYENTMHSDQSSLHKRKSVISSQSTGSSNNEAPLSFTQQLQRQTRHGQSRHSQLILQSSAPVMTSNNLQHQAQQQQQQRHHQHGSKHHQHGSGASRSGGHAAGGSKHAPMLPNVNEYQPNLAHQHHNMMLTNDADLSDLGCMSPLYATPPHSPSSDISSPGALHPALQFEDGIAALAANGGANGGQQQHQQQHHHSPLKMDHFTRDTHMRIILGNASKEAQQQAAAAAAKSSKRSGIATNPAVRMIRNRFDSAAQLIRRTNNILSSAGSSSGQGSSSIGVKSGTFQWRKESQM